eukprot:TRINITY_DN6769_c0_g1_i1.p1 TRINITY_DN6769_c0_g1~~TRINITY_DN6769_c0_g1_i1.p1  ORF type:complete len:452 (+),score=108.89 TRINITY_DN6769_c0_g1_i1:56-1357(+)
MATGTYTLRPDAVDELCAEILSRGLDVEGVFRVPGKLPVVRSMQVNIVAGKDYLGMATSVHDIACTLKMYLRNMKDSLVPSSHVKLFLDAQQVNSVPDLKKAVLALPAERVHTLQSLCYTLSRFASNAEVNKMSTSVLGMLLGPAVMPTVDDIDVVSVLLTTQKYNEVMTSLIAHYGDIFTTPLNSAVHQLRHPATASVILPKPVGQSSSPTTKRRTIAAPRDAELEPMLPQVPPQLLRRLASEAATAAATAAPRAPQTARASSNSAPPAPSAASTVQLGVQATKPATPPPKPRPRPPRPCRPAGLSVHTELEPEGDPAPDEAAEPEAEVNQEADLQEPEAAPAPPTIEGLSEQLRQAEERIAGLEQLSNENAMLKETYFFTLVLCVKLNSLVATQQSVNVDANELYDELGAGIPFTEYPKFIRERIARSEAL